VFPIRSKRKKIGSLPAQLNLTRKLQIETISIPQLCGRIRNRVYLFAEDGRRVIRSCDALRRCSELKVTRRNNILIRKQLIGCIVQYQDAAPSGELIDEEMFEKSDEGLAVLFLARSPRDRVVGPVLGGEDMMLQETLNRHLPCRTLNGLPPLVAYSQAVHSGRPCRPEWEEQWLDLYHIYTSLAPGRWFRRTSSSGTFSLGDQT
jgi:hypothetical protein